MACPAAAPSEAVPLKIARIKRCVRFSSYRNTARRARTFFQVL
ncbi:hypothetical protein BN2497_11961 [Janthinobacterium sp. CG23_2]|nr:hypothetical protein BN2497_11961 [Janthinobacterium sp. CG23_2]CUU32378.1 hypothetical protein BN3177_11961 [Janthinobacterium sp. CG23_2]